MRDRKYAVTCATCGERYKVDKTQLTLELTVAGFERVLFCGSCSADTRFGAGALERLAFDAGDELLIRW